MNRFLVRKNSIANHVNPTNDRSQRRTQFVRDSSEKLVLGAAGRLSIAARGTFFFKQTRVVYGQRDAVSDQLQQPRVIISEFVADELTGMYYADDSAIDEQGHGQQRSD